MIVRLVNKSSSCTASTLLLRDCLKSVKGVIVVETTPDDIHLDDIHDTNYYDLVIVVRPSFNGVNEIISDNKLTVRLVSTLMIDATKLGYKIDVSYDKISIRDKIPNAKLYIEFFVDYNNISKHAVGIICRSIVTNYNRIFDKKEE